MKKLGTTRDRNGARLACVVAMAFALAACGGGGGGTSSTGGSGGSCSTSNPNANIACNSNGSSTIALGSLELVVGNAERSRTNVTVTLRTAAGAAVVNAEVVLSAGGGIRFVSPTGGVGRTDGNGQLLGEIEGLAGGTYQIQAQPAGGLPAVTINVLVAGQPLPTATATEGTAGPGPTTTPTAVDVAVVSRLVVQVNPFRIKSALGGDVTVTVLAFDQNNLGVPGVRLLLDASPRPGTTFNPITPITNTSGIAISTLRIDPGATVGQLVVSATAGTAEGSVPIEIVSGVSERPVKTVVLETDQPVIGADSGGTASLKARVFDADNLGIPDVNVLFITEIGQVSPSVEISCGGNANPCPPTDVGLAQTTLTVPPNAVIRDYNLQAQAGGVIGGAVISIVPGRGGTGTGNPNAAAGQPSSITLGASPTSIVVSGVGGTEQATIIARVYDNNNNPLAGSVLALRVIPDLPDGARMLPLSGTEPPLPQECLSNPDRQRAYDEGRLALGVSDRAGFVLASVRAGALKGTITVEACADSVNADESVTAVVSRQEVVTVAAGPPAFVSVAVNSAFVDNNDGTLTTTVAGLVKDANGNTVEDNTAVSFAVTNRQDVSIIGGSTTNNLPPCDIDEFPAQTGIPVTAQPGTAISCMNYPASQIGTVVELLVAAGGISNRDNDLQDETFNLPPGATSGPQSGVPSARSFSLASQFLNLSGRVTFGLSTVITAFVGDRNGNPVSRETLVTFVTDGGGITSQNVTNLVGRATATLSTQAPIPGDGIAVVTAVVDGEEDFDDLDGDGEFDPEVDAFDPLEHDQDGDGEWSSLTEISAEIPIIFSGRTRIDVEPRNFTLRAGQVQCFDVFVSDDLGNPIVGGSTVDVTTTAGLTVLGPVQLGVPDTNQPCPAAPGACTFQFCVFASDMVTDPTVVGVSFIVQSGALGGGGNGSVATSVSGLSLPAAQPAP